MDRRCNTCSRLYETAVPKQPCQTNHFTELSRIYTFVRRGYNFFKLTKYILLPAFQTFIVPLIEWKKTVGQSCVSTYPACRETRGS